MVNSQDIKSRNYPIFMEKTKKCTDIYKKFYAELIDGPLYEFIVVAELPEDQKAPFLFWLTGRDQPVPYGDHKIDCAYTSDYSFWHDNWIKNKIVL